MGVAPESRTHGHTTLAKKEPEFALTKRDVYAEDKEQLHLLQIQNKQLRGAEQLSQTTAPSALDPTLMRVARAMHT